MPLKLSKKEAMKQARKNYYERNKEKEKQQAALYQKTLKRILVSPALHTILKSLAINHKVTIPKIIENLLRFKDEINFD